MIWTLSLGVLAPPYIDEVLGDLSSGNATPVVRTVRDERRSGIWVLHRFRTNTRFI
jgi:hypothetical protein